MVKIERVSLFHCSLSVCDKIEKLYFKEEIECLEKNLSKTIPDTQSNAAEKAWSTARMDEHGGRMTEEVTCEILL
jgi:hypothetical protein